MGALAFPTRESSGPHRRQRHTETRAAVSRSDRHGLERLRDGRIDAHVINRPRCPGPCRIEEARTLDDGIGFSLIPRKPVIEQWLGQQLAVTVRGGAVSWRLCVDMILQSNQVLA